MKKPTFLGSIRAKLISATCMMLVAVIMVVSSTFAWFTLSTAPEVTGIATSVGANGALEMALSSLDGDMINIAANEADVNRTWGNIVDLGKTKDSKNFYGLDLINLYPSTLLTNSGDGTIKSSPLGTPIYGSDGRVASTKENGTVGVFTGSAFQAAELVYTTANIANGYGVRAIGVSSSMSEREISYRNYLSAASTNAGLAKSAAIASLNGRGADLANVGIKHATASGTEEYTDDDLNKIKDALLDLIGVEGEGGKTGVYGYMWDAMLNFEAAHQSATGSVASGLLSITLADVAADTESAIANSFTNTQLKALYSTFKASYSQVLTAKSSVDGLLADTSDTSYEWSDISASVNCLVDTTKMTINGIPVSDIRGEGNMDKLVNSVLADGGIKLILASGAGVYADIADFCGNYAANITLEKIEYGGMSVSNLSATMQTQTSVSHVYLTKDHVSPASFTDASGSSEAKPLNTFYGYIIDLAFRTNAVDSKLQLQVTPVDRIYEGNTVNPETMGHGTSMSFSSPDGKFTSQKISALMGALRVVFFDTDTAKIVGYARLDSASESIADGEVTMSLKMCDENGTAIADVPDNEIDESISIMSLNQNEIHKLSVLLYLEGDPAKGGVDNSMVAAEAEGGKSLVGTMNLQFSSSANLVPMEYDDLRTGGSSVEGTTAPQYTSFTNIKVQDSSGGTVSGVTAAGGFNGSTGAITVTGLAEGQTITATVGGTSVTLTEGEAGGYKGYTFTASDLTANTEIVITVG